MCACGPSSPTRPVGVPPIAEVVRVPSVTRGYRGGQGLSSVFTMPSAFFWNVSYAFGASSSGEGLRLVITGPDMELAA